MFKACMAAVAVLVFTGYVHANEAKAVIAPTSDKSLVSGQVTLTEENGGLRVVAALAHLTPGKHGLHIHENGSCADTGKAAGGHFNPDKVMHGDMVHDGMGKAHPGDMGNVEADAEGNAALNVFLPGVSLQEGKYAVAGKAMIVHENQDDFSQPTGNAGGRVACGIIEVSQ